MSTIRPLTINPAETQAHQAAQRELQAQALTSKNEQQGLDSHTTIPSVNRQQTFYQNNKVLNEEYLLRQHDVFASHKSNHDEDKSLSFYTSKEEPTSQAQNKRTIGNKANIKIKGDDERDEEDDESGDDDDLLQRPTHQSLISQAGQIIGIGFGTRSLNDSGNDIHGDTNQSLTTLASQLQSVVESSGAPTSSTMSILSQIQELGDVSENSSLSQLQELSSGSDKPLASNPNEGATLGGMLGTGPSMNNPISPMISSSGGDGSLGGASLSQQGIPEPVAVAVRSSRFSDSLLNELTASVRSLSLNTADGRDMTVSLRSDVLADTNIHIVGSGTHIAVEFSTANAASSQLLNAHMALLQTHLTELCPGQVIDIKSQFVNTPSNLRDFNNEHDSSQDDIASFDQGNRGSRDKHDDTL